MPCEHSLQNLLARTDFSKDRVNVHRAIKARAYRSQKRTFMDGQSQGPPQKSVFPHPAGNANAVNQPDVADRDPDEMLCITDDGARLRLFKDAGLLRAYADYEYGHGAVWDAIIHFLGKRTFSASAQPSDALALAVGAALVVAIVERTGLVENLAAHTRQRANTLASLAIPFNEGTVYACRTNLATSKELREQLLVAHGIIVGAVDSTSTFITDMLWCLCAEVSFLVLLSTCPAFGTTATDEFMAFVSAAQRLSLAEAPSVSITSQGLVQYCGSTYKAVGFCQEGVMLGLVHRGVDSSAISLEVTECLFRALAHHNVKGPEDVCAGCSAASEPKLGHLLRFTNPLVSADLKTGRDFLVRTDGTVSFCAETLLYDKNRRKVVRTVPQELTCEVYDMHALVGFHTEACPNLSSLFHSGTEGQIIVATSDGICVGATLQRMDDYEVDQSGCVISITHGGLTKMAEVVAGERSWGGTGGSCFYLEHVVR